MILKCREPEMKRLVEWDLLDVRVDGEKLNRLVQSFRVAPIESLQIELTNGLMRVSGSIRKFIRVPFTVDIAEIRAEGRTVRVPLRSVEAFGGIPMSDEELEKAVGPVNGYLTQVANAKDVDTSSVYSGRVIHLPEPKE